MNALRRGLCPGIATPMQTGDGLLARLIPGTAISSRAFIALCEASQRHGNGIMEVTQRGSIQIRGLTPSSASDFAREVESLGIGADDQPALLQPPLSSEKLQPLLAELRLALTDRPDLASLASKVSVLVDGDGELHLDAIAADIRVRVVSADDLHVAIGGTAHDSLSLGWIPADRAVAAVDELLTLLARKGRDVRAKDLVNGFNISSLQARFDNRAAPPPRAATDPIGVHSLRSGQVALGIALAFGHTGSAALQRVIRVAEDLGATQIQPAPGRALLCSELSVTAANELATTAANEGFIVEPTDSRRHVFACAGSPACGSAAFSTRDLAPAVAKAASQWLDGSTTVHLSGCSKGCAHPTAATLTLAGPDHLILGGRAGDASNATLPSRELLAGLERLGAELLRERSTLSNFSSARIVECLTGASYHA